MAISATLAPSAGTMSVSSRVPGFSVSPSGRALSALGRDRAAMLGVVLFVAIFGAGLMADALAPHSATAVQVRDRFQGPSSSYFLGTDELGRDLLTRLMFGARVSLAVGVVAVAIGAGAGIVLGLVGGYYGRVIDALVTRTLDALLAFPSLLLALAIVSALGPGIGNAMLAIGIVSIPHFARIVRGSVLSCKEKEFVEASRAAGAGDAYLMFRVLLPNCLSPLLVQASLGFANAILTEAALSFLGLGVQPPTPSWGAMLDTGRRYLDQTAWYSSSAGAAIFLAVLSLNLVGDGLRDALDPRLQRGH